METPILTQESVDLIINGLALACGLYSETLRRYAAQPPKTRGAVEAQRTAREKLGATARLIEQLKQTR